MLAHTGGLFNIQESYKLVVKAIGGLKLAMVGVFTPQKWSNTVTQGLFLPHGELIYQHSVGSPSLWTFCQERSSSTTILETLSRDLVWLEGFSGLVVENCFT
jgi:hypothetical protein